MEAVCRNTMTIYSSEDGINQILEAIKDDSNIVSFERFLPTPEPLIEATKSGTLSPALVEQFGAMDVGTWRIKNWGCVRDAMSSSVIADGSVSIATKLPEELMSKFSQEQRDEMTRYTRAVAIRFETTEVPTAFTTTFGERFADARIHYSYDSDPEDVSGWIVFANGKVITHEHYNGSLATIKLHVDPFNEDTRDMLESLMNG